MCEKMMKTMEKHMSTQKLIDSDRRINLYYNDQFALQKTIKSLSEWIDDSSWFTIEMTRFIRKDIFRTNFEHRGTSERQKRMEFLKSVYGWNNHIVEYGWAMYIDE